jgi:hypothetical protein
MVKYDKQDQQGKAAFNERNPHMTQQQEPMARSPGRPQTKTGQGKDRARTGVRTGDIRLHVCKKFWKQSDPSEALITTK